MSILLLPLYLLLASPGVDRAWAGQDLGVIVSAPASFPVATSAEFLQGYVEIESPVLVDIFAAAGTAWQLCLQQGSGSTLPGAVEWRSGNGAGNLALDEVWIASGSGSATVEVVLRVPLRWSLHTPDAYSLNVSFHVYEAGDQDCQEREP